jgi:hypothetical protein
MSTDDLSTARISPNYSVRWEELLRRLATFVLGEKISVRVGENEEDLGIIGRGCIVGDVETVSRDKNGNQTIVVNYNPYLTDCEGEIGQIFDKTWDTRHTRWNLRAIAEDIWKGDIIYLLDGAPRPLIMRSAGLFFEVIVIAVTPPAPVRGAMFTHRLSLV